MSTEATDLGRNERDEELYCYGHPDTPTRLRCSRCERPICGRCAIPASVGQHCPECVAEARKQAPKVRTVLAATAPVTRAILILTGVVFVAQLFSPLVLPRLAMVPILAANGEWWRFITPMLVHGGAFHFMMNAYVLFMIGPAVEQRYGPARFTLIYLASAVGGSIASFGFNDPNIRGVGASGAILGLIGALMVDLYQRRGAPNVGLQIAGMWRWLAFIFGIGLAFQLLSELGMGFILIDNFAHAGGLVAGAALGLTLGVSDGSRPRIGVPVGLAALAFFAAVVMWRMAALSF